MQKRKVLKKSIKTFLINAATVIIFMLIIAICIKAISDLNKQAVNDCIASGNDANFCEMVVNKAD